MFASFSSRFIRETVHQILSESLDFYRRYYKNILVSFFPDTLCMQPTKLLTEKNLSSLCFPNCTYYFFRLKKWQAELSVLHHNFFSFRNTEDNFATTESNVACI